MKTTSSLRLLLLGALLALPLATPADAESTPEARKWLETLLSVYEQGPFQVDPVPDEQGQAQ